MKIHRFYLQDELFENNIFLLENKEIIHQIKDVFRAKVSDKFYFFNRDQKEFLVEISNLQKNFIEFRILEEKKDVIKQNKNIVLVFALLKSSHTEFVLEKCTELGVSGFVPTITDRTIKTGFKKERLEKILKEATEQSGFVKVPQLQEIISLKEFLKRNFNSKEKVFVLDIEAPEIDFEKIKEIKSDEIVYILIGPEGGWSDAERNFFEEKNFAPLSLGKQTLRAETACIAIVCKFL